jgi:hypothetical protein
MFLVAQCGWVMVALKEQYFILLRNRLLMW